MKNCVISVFIILSCLLIGCEDSVVNSLTNQSKNTRVVIEQEQDQQQVEEETKNLVVLPTKVIKTAKNKIVKTKTKIFIKPAKSKIEENSVVEDEAESRRVLDLSLPTETRHKIASNMISYHKPAYLPDLFPVKKKKKYALQVDGKIFDREEKEAEKVSSIDGVGIDVRLYP